MFRFLRLPPIPEVPRPLRDRPLLYMGATCIGTQEEGERLIAPLREIGEPVMDTFGQMPAAGLAGLPWTPKSRSVSGAWRRTRRAARRGG
jgi:hypothetical protein